MKTKITHCLTLDCYMLQHQIVFMLDLNYLPFEDGAPLCLLYRSNFLCVLTTGLCVVKNSPVHVRSNGLLT